ncbi:MAG: hypothetical protein HOP12_07255 [Candidatus Eisenbacteria bacterium]|uniref:3-deoxy-D-manno-octulosonic acid transferase n=1 Tax=Eiseniibacteriota bacterium TaxID=2212470 RepID=A0A849SEZ6_UNCEI|nr:hypothetical protein [Candidatus Eisenbacteria bacterium]
MSAGWLAYRGLTACAGLIEPLAGLALTGVERAHWPERRGRSAAPAPIDAWVHAASMGESLAAAALIEGLSREAPRASIAVTTTTVSARARLRSRGLEARLAPLDTPNATRRSFETMRPRRLFVIETELWFRWLERARLLGVPVAFVSARLSERSLVRYRWLGSEAARLVHDTSWVLAQTREDAERWRVLGADPERIAVIGNLKNDGLPRPAADREAARRALGLQADRPVLVLGSVRPGEAGLLAQAWRKLATERTREWQVVAVPRHPNAEAGLRTEAGLEGLDPAAWRWDARLGVLSQYYAVADVAFVGGSLVPFGGHNPLEAAAAGAAVVFGPHHETQLEAVSALRAGEALAEVSDVDSIVATIGRLLADPEWRQALALRASSVAAAERGAVSRALLNLARWKLWPV